MTPTLAMWSLTLASLVASIFALGVALRSSDRSLSKRLSALSISLDELTATQEAQQILLRNLRARIGMAALRQKRAEAAESDAAGAGSGNGTATPSAAAQSADEKWAADMNRALAEGRIRPFGR